MNLDFLSAIDEKSQLLIETSRYLWENPELAFTEFKSAARLCEVLRAEGFRVEEGLADIPTAFSGRFGSGRPVIGFLGEFDALSGLSQAGGVTERQSLGGAAGQGCGHNLLGTAALGAAIGLKRYLESHPGSGTVIYFGCPGEEGGSGKAFMARDGVFDELDAALTWHPDDSTCVRCKTSLANCQVLYKFDGKASHAGAQPQLGRSALDAVELMNVGVNFLREHMIQQARVHYAITDAGGFSPNVVQPHAEVLYLIRAPRNDQVLDLYARVNDIAKGAALMTGTTESHTFIKACSNTVINDAIQRVMYEVAQEIGVPEITAEDEAFAREMTLHALMDYPKADPEHPIHNELKPYTGVLESGGGSTDVGDVSWVCPTAQYMAATRAYGTPGHSWQNVAQGVMPLAEKTMLCVAKWLSATAVRLLEEPEILVKAKEEHQMRVGPKGYECPIPKGVRPVAMDSLHK